MMKFYYLLYPLYFFALLFDAFTREGGKKRVDLKHSSIDLGTIGLGTPPLSMPLNHTQRMARPGINVRPIPRPSMKDCAIQCPVLSSPFFFEKTKALDQFLSL